jgi:lipoate-protein ligase B
MQFETVDLGLIDYKDAWDKQRQIIKLVSVDNHESVLLLCRHFPVITVGRTGSRSNILAGCHDLSSKGIKVYEVERGGDVTYHYPGQFVIYPIFNLVLLKKDIYWFLRKLEELTIDFLASFGVKAKRRYGFTGVWIGEKKICSIGISIKKWVTFHGLSININNDGIDGFSFIKPCGMDIEMISLEEAIGNKIAIEVIKQKLSRKFSLTFGG